jgi:hypothetical protein
LAASFSTIARTLSIVAFSQILRVSRTDRGLPPLSSIVSDHLLCDRVPHCDSGNPHQGKNSISLTISPYYHFWFPTSLCWLFLYEFNAARSVNVQYTIVGENRRKLDSNLGKMKDQMLLQITNTLGSIWILRCSLWIYQPGNCLWPGFFLSAAQGEKDSRAYESRSRAGVALSRRDSNIRLRGRLS